ncbi:hypothetical protein [Aeromicrobium sp. IC_218]|uniref:hypothetical protein n=1 Tax=Aeromicrobium sp. IC_218 TaxID=2545468 RepID=UPI00103E67E6|nr:hypothetical protein [Aeromicrobium sp. IC_218]TCI99485.1 hypothetical protein E0W78_07060 [Aeromicrobium sp. IC_218]
MTTSARRTVALVLAVLALFASIPEIYLLPDVPGAGWREGALVAVKWVSAGLAVAALAVGRTARTMLALGAAGSGFAGFCWLDPEGWFFAGAYATAVTMVVLLVAVLWIATVRAVPPEDQMLDLRGPFLR